MQNGLFLHSITLFQTIQYGLLLQYFMACLFSNYGIAYSWRILCNVAISYKRFVNKCSGEQDLKISHISENCHDTNDN